MNPRAASALLCTAVFLPAFAYPVMAGPWSLAPGEYYSEFRTGVFVTGSYFDAGGDLRGLLGGGQIEEHSLLSYTELGWKKRLTFVLGIPAKSVTRRFGAGADTSYRPTATGLADGLVGLRYGLANGRTALALELDWKPPLGYERKPFLGHRDSVNAGDTSGDGDSLDVNRARQLGSPTLGEGQQDLTLALHLGTVLSFGFFQVAGGYRYRFDDPADQIVASADLGIWARRSWLIAGHYEGEFAAADADRPTDEVDRQRVGPVVVYRVDDRMDLIAATLHALAASNALHTHEFFVGFAFKNTRLDRLQGFLGGSKAP
ncbi:MAG TPA: hypothetical protein VGK93_01345 [Candidatus Eisenbacteria bacterium]|jgi:hypothetical protein